MKKNVVITGEGIVSAIGLDKRSTMDALLKGESGIGKMKYLESIHTELPVGEVHLTNDEMKGLLGIDLKKVVSRTTLMGIMAVKQAIAESRLKETSQSRQPLKIVLVSGTTVGGMDVTEKYYQQMKDGDEFLDCILKHDCGSCSNEISEYFGIFADVTTISTACSSALNAVILGARMIENGQADLVVAGGTESLSVFHLNGFNSLMILDKNRCRPFDADRNGLNLGEGAAFVVLESEQSAQLRGVEAHAYINGFGNACDAFHQTATSADGEGAFLAMSEAIKTAGLDADDIDYVNAHGTGTQNNDLSESTALNRVFSKKMPLVSSTKSFTGHTTSASGSIELVICILALKHHFVPGNLGWVQPFEGGVEPCLGVKDADLSHIMCNSFGFGGNDSSIVISKSPSRTVDDIPVSAKKIKVLSRCEITDEGDLTEISKYLKPIEARRMGKLMKASLLTSLKALEQAGIDCPDAIVTGTALGCLDNSERLLEQIAEQSEQSLKPTLFMQSTHNTLSSNIAIRIKCHGYNITYTQCGKSLEWAMNDAKMLLETGRCKYVLVGCHDETTPIYRDMMKRLGKSDGLQSIKSVAMVLSCGD